MKSRNNRFFSALLVLAAIFVMNAPAWADGPYSGGSGTAADPWRIGSLEDLKELSETSAHWGADNYFIQTAHIEAADTKNDDTTYPGGFSPIGTRDLDTDLDQRFKGNYDGQGFEIRDLYINRPAARNQGLFGHVGDNTGSTLIRNVRLVNPEVTGGRGVGSLIGRVTGNANTVIEYCSAVGATVVGNIAVGGLVGSFNSIQDTPGSVNNPIIRFSFVTGVDVSWAGDAPEEVDWPAGPFKIAGLAGCSQKGTINNSFARGTVTVDADAGTFSTTGLDNPHRIGGLAGCTFNRGRVENSYAAVTIITPSDPAVSNRGGLIGYVGTTGNVGVPVNSYWDNTLSHDPTDLTGVGDVTDPPAVTGINTTTLDANETGWDEDIWDFSGTYPELKDPLTVTWTGGTSSVWTVAGNWADETLPGAGDSVTIESSDNDPVITGSDVVEIRNLTVASDASLTVESGGTLIVTGTAQGDVTVERALDENRWYLTGAPVVGQGITAFLQWAANAIPSQTVNGETFYGATTYDEPVNLWKPFFTASEPGGDFEIGRGYLLRRTGTEAGSISFTGELRTGNVLVDVSVERFGWNSLGNPYTAPIGITGSATSTANFLAVNAANFVEAFQAIYLWDDTADAYKVVNNATSNNPFDYGTENVDYISSGQGFLVRAKKNDPPGGEFFTFTPGMRIGDPAPQPVPLMLSLAAEEAAGPAWPGVRLTARAGTAAHSTIVLFAEGMSKGLDPGYDAGAPPAGNAGLAVHTRLVEDDGGGDFAVQSLPLASLGEGVTVPLVLKLNGGQDEVSFSVETSGLPPGSALRLLDKKLAAEKVFASVEESYTAKVGPGDAVGRFSLAFTGPDYDGLPDYWKQRIVDAAGPQSGIRGIEDVRAEDDFSGNGMSNLAQYIAGIDPTDPNSRFAVALRASGGSAPELAWESVPGRTYTIQYTTDLQNGPWQDGPRVTGDGSLLTHSTQALIEARRVHGEAEGSGPDAAPPIRFFRVKVEM